MAPYLFIIAKLKQADFRPSFLEENTTVVGYSELQSAHEAELRKAGWIILPRNYQ